jgi:dihydroflavonol-4-reductase
MHIFLTGATGFIGQPLTEALTRRGWAVTALVRRPEAPAARALARLGARLAEGDVVTSEPAALQAAMRGADVVIHNAGWYELGVAGRARKPMRAVNVDGARRALEAAWAAGVPRIVFTSSTVALGDTGGQEADETFQRRAAPGSWYEQTKAEAHQIARELQARGAPIIIVCPSSVIGPGDHSPFGYFARLYVRGLMPPAAWAPESILTMAHVDDVAEGIALAVERGQPGQTYILGGGPILLREMIATWKQTPGGFKPFLWLPRPLALLTGALAEPVLRLAGLPAFLSREAVSASYVSFRFSSAKAQRELGVVFRDPRRAWLDTLAAERDAARAARRRA